MTIKSRDESPGTTRLALDLGAANLTLGSLRIESNEPVFTRAVTLAVPEVSDDGIRERNITDAVIYRVNVNGKNEAHLEIPLESQIHTRELLLLIRNEDSPPISIDTVRADRPACAPDLFRESIRPVSTSQRQHPMRRAALRSFSAERKAEKRVGNRRCSVGAGFQSKLQTARSTRRGHIERSTDRRGEMEIP